MKLLNKITDLLYRKQKFLEITAIFLFFSLITFKFDSKNFKLLWSDYPAIAIILALFTALMAIIWVKIEKQKTQLLITNLKNSALNESQSLESKLNVLSARQKEVFNLIIRGKSNKEIMSELNIELSTLKTHINQVYKLLEIKNRKEAQLYEKQINTQK